MLRLNRKILRRIKKSEDPLYGIGLITAMQNRGEMGRKSLIQRLFAKKEPQLSLHLKDLYHKYESMDFGQERFMGANGVFEILRTLKEDSEFCLLAERNGSCALHNLGIGVNLIFGSNGEISIFEYDGVQSYPDSYRATHVNETIIECYNKGIINSSTLRRAILNYIQTSH